MYVLTHLIYNHYNRLYIYIYVHCLGPPQKGQVMPSVSECKNLDIDPTQNCVVLLWFHY